MEPTENASKAAGAPSALNAGLERDFARAAFYKSADRGEPMHWREMVPDEVWNAAWAAGVAAEREACAGLAEVCDDQESAARFIRARSNDRL